MQGLRSIRIVLATGTWAESPWLRVGDTTAVLGTPYESDDPGAQKATSEKGEADGQSAIGAWTKMAGDTGAKRGPAEEADVCLASEPLGAAEWFQWKR
jgi:hypothetical protein